ncbi:MAG: hypothetical protein ACRDYA_21550 [Egibacteraceae bacterium]
MSLSSFVRVKAQVEGLHHWPNAPWQEGYLRSVHRHMFLIELDLEVFHDDREIEVNAAARWLDDLIPTFAVAQPHSADGPCDFGSQSCEQLAARIADAVLDRYGRGRTLRCAVLEDGILGAGVTWQPDPEGPQ